MNREIIEPEHIGDGLYMLDRGHSVDIAVNDHRNTVAALDIGDIDRAITYLQRVKENLKN